MQNVHKNDSNIKGDTFMRIYKYIITINATPTNAAVYKYKYGSTDGISLNVSPQNASIFFHMSVKKQFQEIATLSVRLVEDALRKIHIFHSLKYNASLSVEKLIISIDGKEKTYDNRAKDFRFFFQC